MKRLLMLVFMISMMSISSAASMTVSVDDTEAAQGNTVNVPILVTGAENIGSIDLVLTYDPAVLQAISADTRELGKNAYLESNTANEGEIVIALADAGGINGDGTVATVSFIVLGEEGTSSQLTLEEVSVHNLDLVELVITH
ncbi:cohesin domain-containing protein [uncultured Methanolobus sp.]|uniref:cohesin domain-containing protein n=1 Tax=uncultured Methanolobus sp. TaxID=218300 RepID=UPI0029C93B31|nr:cohesin domain-containing protein [uncultured Methanolobus sp.]